MGPTLQLAAIIAGGTLLVWFCIWLSDKKLPPPDDHDIDEWPGRGMYG
jgi:hypothetical protein